MASIDWGMIGLGALIGVGCREQLKTAGRVALLQQHPLRVLQQQQLSR